MKREGIDKRVVKRNGRFRKAPGFWECRPKAAIPGEPQACSNDGYNEDRFLEENGCPNRRCHGVTGRLTYLPSWGGNKTTTRFTL